MAKLRQKLAPAQGQATEAASKSERRKRFAATARTDEEREEKSQATAIAIAARTLSQQRLESLGLAQPIPAAQPATPCKSGTTPQFA